jgi:hypothetical protein
MSVDRLRAIERPALVGVRLDVADLSRGNTLWLCEKWSEEAVEYGRRKLHLADGAGVSSELLRGVLGIPAEAVEEIHGNLLLNEGLATMLDLLIGAGGTVYSNANAQTGVGDSTTAEAATQTDLQAATNKTWKAMNATFPSRAAQTLSFQSDFLTAEANYAWQEWSIRNGAAADKNLNRKVASLGTKATGTWTLSTSITFT